MSMIPKAVQSDSERVEVDISGVVVPAKEVGGDLYDF